MPRTDADRSSVLRRLPSVDELLRLPGLEALSRPLLTRAGRELIDELRAAALAGELDLAAMTARCDPTALQTTLLARCAALGRRRHQRVLNATGIVLHTGLGRAPLAPAAVQAIVDAAGYAVVELDPVSGQRDQREVRVAALLAELAGTAAALVVNNNAAATTLMLAALCAGGEVVISRGELVEIGGGFRVPDVLRRAGCTMVEIGTTNKTHLRDYLAASTEQTVAWLKVHPSNFRVEGFASVPSVGELKPAADQQGLVVLDDLGSGLLWRDPIAGLAAEPRVVDSVREGAAVTCFSGDKLLGGPQAGILVGDRERIARCRAHPLYRAMRCDKLTLAALEATLLCYRDGDPLQDVPTLRMLSASPEELERRSHELLALLDDPTATVVASESFAGSGANPARPLPSFAVALLGGDTLAQRLRDVEPVAVFTRQHEGRVLLDARTLLLEDLSAVAATVRRTRS